MKNEVNTIAFSVVTTCRNEIQSLPRWKMNILHQTRPPQEIVIVDAFSDDGTYEYLTEWRKTDGRVRVIQEKGPAAYGRNLGIRQASHEHILSTDLGVRLSRDWCEALLSPFEKDSNIEVVAGNTCIDQKTIKSVPARAEHYIENGGVAKLGFGHVPGNRSIAYKKSVWKQLNGLPEDLSFYADDAVFGRQILQQDLKISYAHRAMTYWSRPRRLNQFFKEQYNYGKGDGEAFIKTPKAFKWYLEGTMPEVFVPISHMFIQLFKKQLYQGMGRALIDFALFSLMTIPILFTGRAYHYAKGYIKGYAHGTENCLSCRNRLRRDLNGYSIN